MGRGINGEGGRKEEAIGQLIKIMSATESQAVKHQYVRNGD